MDVVWCYIHPSCEPSLTAWCQRQEKRKPTVVTRFVHKAGKPSHKFVREQDELLSKSQRGYNGFNPSSTSAGCITQCQGLPARLSAPDSLGPEQARQIHVSSFNQQDSLVLSNRCHQPFHMPQWGWEGRTQSAWVHAGSKHITEQSPTCDPSSPWHKGLHLSLLTELISRLSKKQKLKPSEPGTMQADKPCCSCCSLKENAARFFGPLYPNRLAGSRFHQKLLPAFTATQRNSLQPTQWERRQAPSEKDKLALCLQLQQSVYCNITVRKAHWNSSIHHPCPGKRVITSTRKMNRAKVNWSLSITLEHLDQEGCGQLKSCIKEDTARTDLRNGS